MAFPHLQRPALLPLLLLLSSPAIAACPTGADMANGIGVRRDDAVSLYFFTLDDVAVSQTLDFGNGLLAKNVLYHGTYPFALKMEQDTVEDEASNMLFIYEKDPSEMAPPAPGLVQVLRTYVRPKLDPEYPETQTATWGELTDVAIGTCTYQAIFGSVDYASDAGLLNEGLMYLPELGISLQTSYAVVGDASQSYVYGYTEIVNFE